MAITISSMNVGIAENQTSYFKNVPFENVTLDTFDSNKATRALARPNRACLFLESRN